MRNIVSPYKKKVDKIFEKLHNKGQLQQRPRQEKAITVRQRLNKMNSTYNQTLQRDMFLRQRERTDRVHRQCIQGERRRLIKSAQRRNNMKIYTSSGPIQKLSKQFGEPKEWRSNQQVLLQQSINRRNTRSPQQLKFNGSDDNEEDSIKVMMDYQSMKVMKNLNKRSGSSTQKLASRELDRTNSNSAVSKNSAAISCSANSDEKIQINLADREKIVEQCYTGGAVTAFNVSKEGNLLSRNY